MKDGTYHKDLGNLPVELFLPFIGVNLSLVYSHHAQRAVLDDRYGPPLRVPFRTWFDVRNVIEVEVVGGNAAKIVVRLPQDRSHGFEHTNPDLDLVLVLSIQSAQCRELFVKTLWFNDRTDDHATLDRTKYVAP